MPFSFFPFYASFYKFCASVTIFQISYFVFYPVIPLVTHYFLFSAIATTVVCLLAVVSSFSVRSLFGYLSASSAVMLLLPLINAGEGDLGFFLVSTSFFLAGTFVYSSALFLFFSAMHVLSRELNTRIYYVVDLAKLL
jgi:hypothetical protein